MPSAGEIPRGGLRSPATRKVASVAPDYQQVEEGNWTQNRTQASLGKRDAGSVLVGDEVSADRRALEPELGALDLLTC